MARVTRRAGRMLSTESSTRAMATRSNTRVTGGAGGPSTSRRGSRRTSTGTTNNSTDGISNRVIQRRRSSTASPAAAQAPRRRRQVREPTPESESDEDEVEDSVTIYSAVPDKRVEAFISFGSDSEMSFINVHGNNVTINISSTADDDSNVDADEEDDEEDDEEESDEEEEILPHDREMSPVDLHDEEDEVLSRPDENENPNVISTEMFGDCTICLEDKPQDPVGCLHCQQLVGCRKCVMKWYNTSSSIEAKKLCPLCRHKWEQRPEVCTMFDLVITS